MHIQHGTYKQSLEKILREGIRPSAKTKIRTFDISQENLVYLLGTLDRKSFGWGPAKIFIDVDWIMDNVQHFMNKSYHTHPYFDDFVSRVGIKDISYGDHKDFSVNQLVTDIDIPVEAFDSLVIEYKNTVFPRDECFTETEALSFYDKVPKSLDFYILDQYSGKMKLLR